MSELNLLPHELRRGTGLSGKNLFITIAAASIIVLLMIAYPLVSLFSLQSREKKLNAEVQKGEAILKESDNLKQEIDSYTKYIQRVQALTSLKTSANAIIKKIEGAIPGDVFVDNLTYGPGIITITAKANDPKLFDIFAVNLREKGQFKDVRILNWSKDAQGGSCSCSISIQYEEVVK